jgi:hypothetical protein
MSTKYETSLICKDAFAAHVFFILVFFIIVTKSVYISGVYVMHDAKVTELKTQ